MKKIISIISITMMSIVMQGQIVKPVEQYFDFKDQNNIYFKDVNNHYNKFLGEWEAIDGLHYIKIKIMKVPKVEQGLSDNGRRMMKIRRYVDEIVIECIYKYNGNEIYNTISTNNNSNFCIGQIFKNTNQLSLIYLEPHTGCGRDRTGMLNLTFITGTLPQLQWNRSEKPSLLPESYCPENQVDTSPYKIPANLTFTKL